MIKKALTIWLCLASLAGATTYYLDIDASGANNGTSWENAWESIADAQAGVSAGDTVLIAAGSYGVFSLEDYTNTSYITWQANAGETVVFDQILIDNYPTPSNVYLIFDGIHVESSTTAKGVWARNASYLQLKNLDVSGGVDLMAIDITLHGYPGIRLENSGGSAQTLIQDCLVHSDSESLRVGYTQGIDVYNSDDVTIDGCTITDGGYGIFVYGDDVVVQDCNVVDVISDGIMVYGCNDLLITGNEVHGLAAYQPTLDETVTDTTWSADGKTMTNALAHWKTAGNTLITTNMVCWVVSGTNANASTLDHYPVASITSDTEVVLSESIGANPSAVTYYFVAKTHCDLLQVANVANTNLTVRNNQFYNVERYGRGNIFWFYPLSCDTATIENNLCWNIYTDEYDERRCNVAFTGITNLYLTNNLIIGRLQYSSVTNVDMYSNIASMLVNYTDTVTTLDEDYNVFNRAVDQLAGSPYTISNFTGNTHDTVLNPGLDPGGENWQDVDFTGIFTSYSTGVLTYAAADSTGVDDGDVSNHTSLDILGVARGALPDCGCYERGGSSPMTHKSVNGGVMRNWR